MLKKFRRLIFFGLKSCVLVSWKLKQNFLLSKLLGSIVIFYNKKEIVRNNKKTTILAMERTIFDEDIKALKEYPSNYNIIVYPALLRALMFEEVEGIWPEKQIKQQGYFYKNKDMYPDFYKRISNIFYKSLMVIESFTKNEIKIILTANIDYYQDYPWIAAIHKNNGKFVVIEKESILYLRHEDRIKKRHIENNFHYEGDAVLFYNKYAKEFYESIGTLDKAKTEVIGCPRVDRLMKLEKEKPSNFALFTSFKGKPNMDEIFDDILTSIDNDEQLRDKIIIKCKDGTDMKYVHDNYPRLQIKNDPMENYLLKNPAVISGVNTTACLDALIIGIPVLVPWWGKVTEAGDYALLGKHTSDFHSIAFDKESYVKILRNYINKDNENESKKFETKENINKMKKYITDKYSLIDGKNSQRFFEFIDKIL